MHIADCNALLMPPSPQSVPEWVAQEDVATSNVYRQSSRHLHDGVGGRFALQQHWERQQQVSGGRDGAFDGSPRSQGMRSLHGRPGSEDALSVGGGRRAGSLRSVGRLTGVASSGQGELVEEGGDACGGANGSNGPGCGGGGSPVAAG